MIRPSAGFSAGHVDVPALIMGNGKSLRRVNFHALNGYATFGMNAAYRYWQQIDWWPTYYSCLDLIVGESHREQIRHMVKRAEALGIRRFLLRQRLIDRLGPQKRSPRITCYEQLLADWILPKLTDVTTGSHTLLWADSLGYSTLLLAGVDCDYVEVVEGAVEHDRYLEIEREQPNPNYFFEGYQRRGDRYNIPNHSPGMHIRSWRNVSRHLRPGTVVINLNPESQVDAFPLNTDSEAFLEPGIIRIDATQNETWELAPLRDAIRRYARDVSQARVETVLTLAEGYLNPSESPEVTKWRTAFEFLPIELSSPGSPPSCAPGHALPITIQHLGNLHLEKVQNVLEITQTIPQILVRDPRRLPQACQLIRLLHDHLAPTPRYSRFAKTVGQLACSIRKMLPMRLRVLDYSSLGKRILYSLMRRKRKQHCGP